MHLPRPSWLLVTVSALLAVTPLRLGAQAPAWFQSRTAYLLRDGGRWWAANPGYDSTQAGAPSHFGYRFEAGPAPSILRLRITGRVGQQQVLYWEGFYYWHPAHGRARYVSLGTGGAVATGETVDTAGTLIFEILGPDGTVTLHRDEETDLAPTTFRSHASRFTDGRWVPEQTLLWEREPR